MTLKKHIPNAITCCNLFCGCLAIVAAFAGNLVLTGYLVALALIFDFFDGFAARVLRVVSPIGKDLDSLADMVTFGVVPGIVMYKLILKSIENYTVNGQLIPAHIAYLGFIITIFSAIRLAKFNNDTRQTTSFIGVPTPANAILICSIPLILQTNSLPFIINPFVLITMSFILSLLLISEIPLFALKFKSFGWQGNRIRFIFIGLSILLLIILQFIAIPLIIVLYVLISLITQYYMKQKMER